MIRLRPSHLALAAGGGALGTLVRFGIVSVSPSWETLSAGTVAVNILGPFMLGVLLQLLSEGTESKRRRAVQLFAGVGFLGAFTSYAQLAVDTVTVSEHGHPLRVRPGHVHAVSSAARATAAPRPLNSRLDTQKLQSSFGLFPQPWQLGVERMLREWLRPPR